ncbi:MAG: polyprenol monophosphomannose synthase [Acidobacteria bacterium]|nr:polyprenol monophosphomannose synthase [Acidobacteriota bacterium]
MLSLIVPTYNERQNIVQLVARAGKTLAATGEPFELIIVDDNSPDGTAGEVRRLQAERPWLKLLVREDERDLSTAVLAGWKMAQGEILGVMDGDLQHPPEILLKLFEAMRQTHGDIVVASRNVEHGSVSDWKFRRRIISWTATLLAAVLLPAKIRRVKDPMSGFFLLRRTVVEGRTLKPLGYKILLEVLARGNYEKAVEVPYVFEERARGGSKMGVVQVWRYLVHLARIRFTS